MGYSRVLLVERSPLLNPAGPVTTILLTLQGISNINLSNIFLVPVGVLTLPGPVLTLFHLTLTNLLVFHPYFRLS